MTNCISINFWKDKTVFLTGHTGFKGSWMCQILSLLGAKVVGYSLPPNTEPSMFSLLGTDEHIVTEFGDINDYKTLSCSIKNAEPDIVIHMAAQPIVSVGYSDPIDTFRTNVLGTVHVLEACRELSSSVPILVISSDKCYLNDEKNKRFVVGDSLGGDDPYSASKAGTEIVVHSYSKSFYNTPKTPFLASARAGNVVGGGDWSLNRLIPDAVRSFNAGDSVLIRNPNSTRPWQHVLEPLFGYLLLIEAMTKKSKFARSWNFGPNEGANATVMEVVQLLCECWGGKSNYLISENISIGKEAKYLGLDCDETYEQLGWKPVLNFDDTISWTIDWYKTVYMNSNFARQITERQIKLYMQMLKNANLIAES